MSVINTISQATLSSATPLLLAALGENAVQKAGVVNVGLEGMMLTGAFTATLGTLYPQNPLTGAVLNNPVLGVLLGSLAGAALALLFAYFAVGVGANQVVVGVVINLLALGLTGTLYRKFFGTTGQFITTNSLARLAWFGNFTALTLLTLLAVPCAWWWLFRTRRGLELRACGEQPNAAEAAGVNVTRMRWVSLLFSGALAGAAGAFLSVGDSNTFIPNMTAGRGFIALAIVTAGRWNPYGCLAASLLFGFAESLQYQGQAMGLRLPYQLFLALPYIVTLFILMRGSNRSEVPAMLGQLYRRL